MTRLFLACLAASLCAAEPLELPFFRQQKNGCGAASVAMVAHYWAASGYLPDAPPPQEIYRKLYDPARGTIPLSAMALYLENLGYRAFSLRGKLDDLQSQIVKGRPVIVSLSERAGNLHFAVVSGVETERIWLHDPSRKRPRRLDRREFEASWNRAGSWMLLAAPMSR